jgi:hypothetical protein
MQKPRFGGVSAYVDGLSHPFSIVELRIEDKYPSFSLPE